MLTIAIMITHLGQIHILTTDCDNFCFRILMQTQV